MSGALKLIRYPGKTLYYGLNIIETSVTLLYILGICEARDCQSSLPQRGQLLGSGLRV